METRQNNFQGRPPPGLDGNVFLEDRLRHMILNNDLPDSRQPESRLPPFDQTQTISVPPQSSLAEPAVSATAGSQPIQGRASQPESHIEPQRAPASPKAARKRPNQAQRRQMNAQLSIPVDTRPTDSWPPRQFGHDSHHPAMRHKGPREDYRRQNAGSNAPTSSQAPKWPDDQRSHQYAGRGNATRQGPYISHQDAAPSRGGRGSYGQLYNPHGHQQVRPEDFAAQSAFLQGLCGTLVAGAEIEREEIAEKESFRIQIEGISRQVIHDFEKQHHGRHNFAVESVALRCFGSLASGFATKASDMDLGLVSPLSEPQPDAGNSDIPRLIEKAFLDHGFGARLLTRTRVPIIKVCEKPSEVLLRDLLEARHKWENGIVDHPDGADAEDDMDEISATEKPDEVQLESPATPATVPLASEQARTAPTHFKLRQLENQSLASYHGTAKRLLRKLDGRDITVSNHQDFGREDYELLLRVCKSFVEGLRDPELRERLQSYRSLSFPSVTNGNGWRSLLGVFTQVEGESMVIQWEKRTVLERAPDKEHLAEGTVAHWKSLQDQPEYGTDPLLFTKQLQIHAERLKKLSSIQLLTLEQTQYETASEYQDRTLRIIANIRPAQSGALLEFHGLTVDQYVAGIWSHDIRGVVQEFVENAPEPHSIGAVARRHKSLQLAMELEKALDKKLYDPSLDRYIRSYIDVLRSPLVKLETHLDYVLPTPDDQLLEVISRLPNPSKMAPNQPRDRYRDQLEFPKAGVGVQCDINFSAHLALQNTTLLRCYSHTDPRVRPLILFVKHWAKMRGINTPYRGTLSSYGYVLMMLHYLVNVAQPFVCPNLQALGPPPPFPVDHTGRLILPPHADGTPAIPPFDETLACRGRFVGFWRDEDAIRHLASVNQLNGNRDSVGHLLRGFFEYYAQNGAMTTYRGARGFDWGRDVLSLRTPGGLVSKQAKGWTGAKTVVEYQPSPNAVVSPTDPANPPSSGTQMQDQPLLSPAVSVQSPASQNPPGSASTSGGKPPPGTEVKEVRHRYLFAIEDPFELDHNVARTVTHNGIVSIRDEFRRAWRIIKTIDATGQSGPRGAPPEQLLEDVNAVQKENSADDFTSLLAEIHGLGLRT